MDRKPLSGWDIFRRSTNKPDQNRICFLCLEACMSDRAAPEFKRVFAALDGPLWIRYRGSAGCRLDKERAEGGGGGVIC